MKRFRKALGIVALALVVSLSLAMPVSAWADEAETYGKPDVSGPQSAWYNGQSHHFRSTVKDSVSGKDLVEGTDYTRSFGFLRDRGNADDIDTWLETDDSFASSGFVYDLQALVSYMRELTSKAITRETAPTLCDITF